MMFDRNPAGPHASGPRLTSASATLALVLVWTITALFLVLGPTLMRTLSTW